MKRRHTALLVALFAVTAFPVFAHHDFAATFDWKAPVAMTGTVSTIAWENPHVLAYIDVRDARGDVSVWTLELGSPKALAKYGWSETTLVPGERIAFDGWLARDGSKFVSARSIALSTGVVLFGASSFYDTPGICVSGEYCVDEGDEEFGGEFSAVKPEEFCAPVTFDAR